MATTIGQPIGQTSRPARTMNIWLVIIGALALVLIIAYATSNRNEPAMPSAAQQGITIPPASPQGTTPPGNTDTTQGAGGTNTNRGMDATGSTNTDSSKNRNNGTTTNRRTDTRNGNDVNRGTGTTNGTGTQDNR